MKVPSRCPCCGAYSLAPDSDTAVLLAVTDVLTLKALEKMGGFIVRVARARYAQLGGRPYYLAHTLWPTPDEIVDKALKGAWDVVPALIDIHGCCGVTSTQVTQMLDRYVHDLVITGTPHTVEELQYRFESQLGIPVFDHLHALQPSP